MIKTRNIFILFTMLFVILAGCNKEQEVVKEPVIDERTPEVYSTVAYFKWTVDYPGKIASMVEVGRNADMSDAVRYGSDAETSDKNFKATVTGLKEGIQYYYRYVVWNPNSHFNMPVKHFTTQTDVAKVNTVEVSEVTRTTAKVTCEVTDESGSAVLERGLCWGTGPDLTTSGPHIVSGTGTGTYTITLTDLRAGQTYYVRAYAYNANGTAFGEELSFVTDDAVIPMVTTAEVTDIAWRTATAGGEVTDTGGLPEMERGICWGTSHNPEFSGDHVESGSGSGSYSAPLTGLTAGTTYYVRAYAKNEVGIGYGEEKSFQTKAPEIPTVTTMPVTGITSLSGMGNGAVTSDGGTPVTECGIYFGTSPNPLVTGTQVVSSSVEDAFFCLMEDLNHATTYYVRAYATNGQGTGYGDEVPFTTRPEGSIGAYFSIGSEVKVCFSQGNLQYQASSGTWRFAEHQIDYLGEENENISSTNSGWIDLFGWGTSGWNSGVPCYQPWSISRDCVDYFPGYSNHNMTGSYANADWGVYNPISNGGNQAGLWRTMTKDEWLYLTNMRQTASGIHYAKACVNEVNGLLLLPDEWDASYFSLNNTDDTESFFSSNIITAEQWTVMERLGVVFLPAAGMRISDWVRQCGTSGFYFSATHLEDEDSCSVYMVFFGDWSFSPYYDEDRSEACSVRLVRPVQ